MEYRDPLTEKIIGCAIEVHRALGPGLLEAVYEAALEIELQDAGLNVERQKSLPVLYKGRRIGDYRIDLLVEDKVVLELKSADRMERLFSAQTLGYLRLGRYETGLLMNFNVEALRHGIKRFVL